MSKISKKVLIPAGILILGLFISLGVYQIAFNHWTKNIEASALKLRENYAKSLESETDAYKLAKRGLRQINLNQSDYAIITLERAAKTDEKYRDAFYLLGVAKLKNGQTEEAIQSLEKAAALDPIYPPTFKLLASAYGLTKDKAKEAAAQSKYDFLNKTR